MASSFESMPPQPQFTNQLAYQALFSPPGFSFESPFSYPASGSSSSSGGMMSSGHEHTAPEGQRSNASTHPTGAGQDNGMPAWSVQQQQQQQDQKKAPPSLHDFFNAPPVRLNTGDRFSQLLDQKLGLDQQLTSSAFTSTSSAPPHGFNVDTGAPSYQYPNPNYIGSYPPQNWDQLAIESNLQDYSQVQIQPDLVAPMPPVQYFGYEYMNNGMPMQIASGSGSGSGSGNHMAISHPQEQQQGQQQTLSPYPGFTDAFPPMSAPPMPVPVQSSPASMSMSSQSSPSVHPSQIGTPQSGGDLRWPTPYPSGTPPVPLPRHAQSQPILRHTSADTTPYQPFQRVRLQSDLSSPMTAGPAGLGGNGSPLAGPPLSAMPSTPVVHSQSYPGPSGTGSNNGAWAHDMIASSSAPPRHPMPLPPPPQQSTLPLNMYSQPLSRSSSQNTWSTTDYISTHTIPSTFPPAPALSKRSRSPQSHHSSLSLSDREDAHEAQQALKKPKLSLPMSMPSSCTHPHSHGDEEADKKPVIACHTCRARKLKCDGARPKCHHCSRRNEDSCVYDAVLRRRGPGKKNKSKQKGDAHEQQGHRSVSPATAGVPRDTAGSAGLGSRFEMSTERS